MEYDGKIVVISGASTGIGRAAALSFVAEGAKVYNLDIKKIEDQDTVNFLRCDMSSYEDVAAAINEISERELAIDVLFANAGIHHVGSIEDTDVETFLKVVNVNVSGVFYLLKSVLPIMRKQNKGKIVLTGSDQCFAGKGKSAAYGLTKGAIGQLTKSTAIDYAPYNINVNCVCPGTIETPLLDKAVTSFASASGMSITEVNKVLQAAQPIQRLGKASEVAELVLFLASEKANFITGSLHSIDGGYSAQ